jgi:hypothetical protein
MRHAACSGIWLRLRRVDPLQATATSNRQGAGWWVLGVRRSRRPSGPKTPKRHIALHIAYYIFLFFARNAKAKGWQKQKQKRKREKGAKSEKGQCDPPPRVGSSGQGEVQGTRHKADIAVSDVSTARLPISARALRVVAS